MVKQRRFVSPAPLEKVIQEDEHGSFQLIPLSMVLGGEPIPRKVHLDPVKHIRIDSSPAPRGWYKGKREPKGVRPRPCYSEAILTTPYTGYCNVGCRFCYIDFGSRGYHATGLPAVNEDYPLQIERQLAKMMITGPIYLSSFTEVFQELESRYHIVQRLCDLFARENVPIFFLSRKIPPIWAEETLRQNSYSYIQWSVNAADEATYRRLSPGSYTLAKLYRAVEHYKSLNIFTSFQINPILPGIISLDEIKQLVKNLAEAGGNHVIFKFCESNLGSYKELLARLRGLAGVDEFASLMTQIIGGVRTIRQDLRISWLQELLPFTQQLGISMSLCYEYYDDGGAGANLAPWFTTSDQCHGPAVPIHYRPALGEKFIALPGCYRKGCLYCEDYGTKVCHNTTLLSAKALQYKDYRSIRLEGQEEDWELPESSPSPEDARYYLYCGARGYNPNLVTDATLWGLPPLEEVLRR